MEMVEPIPQYNLFKEYCSAMKDFLTSAIYLDRFERNNNVRIYYSTPARAWAKYVQPIINGFPNTPVITFYLSANEFKTSEIMGGFVNMYENHPTDPDKLLSTYSPTIWKLEFTATYWSALISDMDKMMYQSLMYTMPPKLWAGKIDDKIWYEIGCNGNIGFEDELEPGETKDKLIRRGLTFYVPRAYLPRESLEVNKIKEFHITMENYVNKEELGIVIGGN
jgi:hypothetical protein